MYRGFQPDGELACVHAFRRSSDQAPHRPPSVPAEIQLFKATYVGKGQLPNISEFASMPTKDIAIFKDAAGQTSALLMFASQAGQMTPGNSYDIDYIAHELHRNGSEEAHDHTLSLLQHNPPVMGVFASFTAIRLNRDTTGLKPYPVSAI